MTATENISNPARPARRPTLGSKVRGTISFGPRLPARMRWIIGAVLLIGMAAGFAYYKLVYAPSLSKTTTTLQSSVVRPGSLVVSASGTGTLVSKDEVNLAFQNSGKVTEVDVKVGDQVKEGGCARKSR